MRTLQNKKVLITGGAGFIGSHVAGKLLDLGCKVTVFDQKKGDIKKVKYLQIKIEKLEAKDLHGFDFIFHLAGSVSIQKSLQEPLRDFEENLHYTVLLLENIK